MARSCWPSGLVAAAALFSRRAPGFAGGAARRPRRSASPRPTRSPPSRGSTTTEDGKSAERRRRPAPARGARCAPARRRSRAGCPSSATASALLAEKTSELEDAREQQIRELERVACMSASQARNQLLKELEDQTRHDRAKVVRQVEEETKRDADRRVRNILSVVMQRLAAGHAAETTV